MRRGINPARRRRMINCFQLFFPWFSPTTTPFIILDYTIHRNHLLVHPGKRHTVFVVHRFPLIPIFARIFVSNSTSIFPHPQNCKILISTKFNSVDSSIKKNDFSSKRKKKKRFNDFIIRIIQENIILEESFL